MDNLLGPQPSTNVAVRDPNEKSGAYAENAESTNTSFLAKVFSKETVIISVVVLVILALVCSIVIFPLLYMVNMVNYKLIDDPLNKHHPSFKFTTMMDVFSRWTPGNAFSTYRIFLLIPSLLLVFAIGFLIYAKRQGSTLKWYVWAFILGVPFAILGITIGVLILVSKFVSSDMKAIRKINAMIQASMHNSAGFNILATPNVDRLQQISTYQTLLANMEEDDPKSTEEAYAKALFTVNLYLAFYNIGMRHKNMEEALRVFRNTARIITPNYADFLNPKTGMIPNRIHEITNNVSNTNISAEIQQRAITRASRMIAELNNVVGSVSYTSALGGFLIISIVLIALYALPTIWIARFILTRFNLKM